jgi:pectinesterase
MHKIGIILLFIGQGLFGQNTQGLTGIPDTSFANYSAWKTALKSEPALRLAEYTAAEIKNSRSIVYRQIGQQKLVLDVYEPQDNLSRKTLLFFHGGGWRTGHRSQHVALAEALVKRGYRVFLAEYRLSTQALYPAAMLDAQAALTYIHDHSKELHADAKQIFVAGFSAGGQMAALLGSVQDENLFGKGKKIKGVIDLDGILAFIHPESGEGDDRVRMSAATTYFGYSKTENPDLWNQASALFHVSKHDPPVLFINSGNARMHAGRDDFQQKMRKFGLFTDVYTFQESPHTFLLFTKWFGKTVQLMDQFMRQITVAQDGSGDVTTIQAALRSGENNRTIFIKNGLYQEKVFIDSLCHDVRLIGESRTGVVLKFTQARDIWRCANPDDYGAGVLNIKGHDLSFENLTVINVYGLITKQDVTIPCLSEAGKSTQSTAQKYALPRESGEKDGEKIVRVDGHQFAVRTMPGATRLRFEHCTFRSGGGDTVSPWDANAGLYYFNDCEMEGGVDLYCPRGYALAENCTFICHNLSAAIWHDGSGDVDAKSVLKNCRFLGDTGFKLGRYHREAQLFLFDCQFAQNMADSPIYQAGDRSLMWGHRVYYANCHRTGGDFAWHQTNTEMRSEGINFKTVFGDKWP